MMVTHLDPDAARLAAYADRPRVTRATDDDLAEIAESSRHWTDPLAAADSWHSAQGYVSGRDMHRIVYHREHGEVSREVVNVAAVLRAA